MTTLIILYVLVAYGAMFACKHEGMNFVGSVFTGLFWPSTLAYFVFRALLTYLVEHQS